MELSHFLVLILVIIAGFCILKKNRLREGMGGYGTISGLAYNNGGRVCWKNPYDPEFNEDGTRFLGYCGVIGKVVV